MNAEITQLFSVPLYRSKIDITENDVDNVRNIEYHEINDGELSDNVYILELPVFNQLKMSLLDHLHNYCEILKIQDNIEFYITNSWVTLHKHGNGSPLHFHNNSLISGILYIKCDKNSGNIGFAKSWTTITIFPQAIDIQFKEDNLLNMKEIAFNPSPGDGLLFPSFLNHYVTPSNSDQNRYAIAFNVFVKGTLEDARSSGIDTLHIQ